MEIEDELFLEDDLDILEIIDFGFPRRNYLREEYFDVMDNYSFFKRFRLTKQTTVRILEQVEEHLEFDNDLNNSVSPMNQLLASLRFYSCGTHQDAIGDFMGMHQTTASRVTKKVSETIARLRPAYISMPTGNEIIQIQNEFYQLARFPGVVGCLDGTHIKIKSPGGIDAEIYRNRKGYFSLNVQVICDSKLMIRDIVARWPGSVHDLTIFNHSRIRARMEAEEFPNSVLLADSGYADRPYLMTPLGNPNNRAEQLYNESQIRTRNCVERQIGVWKMRFLSLLYGLRCKLQTCLSVVVATAVLHNIAGDMNEDMPPALDNIDEEQLRYLVQMGNIPHVPNNENNLIPMNNHRRNLINQFFAHL